MMVIPVVIGAPGTVTKGLVKDLENLKIRELMEIILTTVLLKSARMLRRVLETCLSNSSVKPSAKAGVKNSQRNDNNY